MELYLHIPFCRSKCSYCDFLSAPADENTQTHYVNALLREIRYYEEHCRDREVSTIYIGGGTPSWLAESYVEILLKQLHMSFFIRPDAEITIECNPGTLTKNKLKTYQASGINRLSMGLQSTNNEELKILGRTHTYEQFLRNYELARELGYANINIDLMSALPYQTTEGYLASLEKVVRLKPEHISAYSLIIEKGTPFYEQYKFDAVKREAGMETEYLPSEEIEYEIYEKTNESLQENGYHHYEISNYAKAGFECRHNIGYWKRVDYLGLGLGAASLMDNVRYSNIRKLDIYIEETKKEHPQLREQMDVLERKEQIEEFMFLGLRMTDGIKREDFFQTFGMQIDGIYHEVIRTLVQEELLEQHAGFIKLTKRGMDISNYVLAQFLLGTENINKL